MSMYSKTQEEKQPATVKACPKCHKLMKSAVIKGKTVWVCVSCGIKTEAAGDE